MRICQSGSPASEEPTEGGWPTARATRQALRKPSRLRRDSCSRSSSPLAQRTTHPFTHPERRSPSWGTPSVQRGRAGTAPAAAATSTRHRALSCEAAAATQARRRGDPAAGCAFRGSPPSQPDRPSRECRRADRSSRPRTSCGRRCCRSRSAAPREASNPLKPERACAPSTSSSAFARTGECEPRSTRRQCAPTDTEQAALPSIRSRTRDCCAYTPQPSDSSPRAKPGDSAQRAPGFIGALVARVPTEQLIASVTRERPPSRYCRAKRETR